MTYMPPTITTREGLRDALRFELAEKLEEILQPVTLADGDVWDGVNVVTKKDINEAVAAIFDVPLPPLSETHVEVATPGTVVVSTTCPRCHGPRKLTLEVSSQLVVSDETSELRLKAKSKPATHVCGQLEFDDVVPGQGSLDDILDDEQESDGTGVPMEGIEVPADGTEASLTVAECPYPHCTREEGHRGRHNVIEPNVPPEVDGDSDLLPA